jgi:hypothetical protein
MKIRKIKDISIKPDSTPEIRSSIQKIPEENIKSGLPTAWEAGLKLEQLVEKHKQLGSRVFKVIHGYGSSGVGGVLRVTLRSQLKTMQGKTIVDFIPGEELERSLRVLRYLDAYPELEWDGDYGKNNRGITMVLMPKRKGKKRAA